MPGCRVEATGGLYSFVHSEEKGGRAGLHLAARTYLGGYSSPNPLGHPDTERYFPSFSHGYEEKAGYYSFLIGIGKGLQQ